MNILFPYTPHNQVATARRALQCALEMQTTMHRYEAIPTRIGQFSLAMKAGLALGPVLCTTVGDPTIRLEHIIAGSALDLCAEAEHNANQGGVVAHNDLLPYAEEVEVIGERADFSCVVSIKPRARPKPLVQPKMIPPEVMTTLSHYLHPVIAQRLNAGLSGFINEHRKVTVLFVSFEGFDIATQFERKDIQFQANLLSVHLQVALNQVDKTAAGGKLMRLFNDWPEDDQQAAMHYELWRLDNERVASRRAAADLYRDLYHRTPNIEYRRCYEALTGNTLPDPPPLPKLPEVIPRESINLDNLLEQIEALVEDVVEEEGPTVA